MNETVFETIGDLLTRATLLTRDLEDDEGYSLLRRIAQAQECLERFRKWASK